MSREIKFRIWSKPLQRWVTDLFLENISDIRFATINGFFDDITNNENIVVQQYIGAKDKNKIYIYEGDIISIVDSYNETIKHVGVVEDVNGEYTITTDSGWYTYTAHGGEDVEVLGNIFENEDLLK